MINGVLLTPLRRIPAPKGEVRHGVKAADPGFVGFGEAYFTEVLHKAVKGWKRHRLMTMNLIVVSGAVRFIVHDGRQHRNTFRLAANGSAAYARLTVPPGLWMAFQGLSTETNLLMNLASHMHDPEEADSCELERFGHMLSETDSFCD